MESANSSSLFSLTIDPLTKAHLGETARWARFLAIVGMIVLVLGLIVSLMATTVFTRFMGFPTGVDDNNTLSATMRGAAVVVTVITLAIVFFPLLFLLRFANAMRRALAANDQTRLNESFQNLKVYFRYLGILVIIFLVLYGIIIAIGVMGIAANR